MGSRFLSIDWRLDHHEIQRGGFFDGPSFAGVEALFVDPGQISERWVHDVPPERDGVRRTYVDSDRGFGRVLSRLIAKRRIEASDLLLKSGGLLVCRMWPRGEVLEIVTQGTPGERIDRTGFLPHVTLVDRQHQLTFPGNGRFLPRRGDDVVLEGTGHPIEEYLAAFEGHVVYQAVYQDLLSTPIDHFATVLARNRVGDVVAVEIPYDEGRLVLLPLVEGVSPAREADALLDALRTMTRRPAYCAVPDWLPAYPVPGEEEVVDELAGLVSRRDKLQLKVEEVSARLEAVAGAKRILYTAGRFSLIPASRDAFVRLGFEVEDGGMEILLRSDEGDAIAAAAAVTSAEVGIDAYRRLLRRVDRARTEASGPEKGILVVSGSRERDPKHRPTQFSTEVLRGCKSQGFCLITTYMLFKLVRRALEEKDADALATMRRQLLECEGEFRGVK